MKHLSADESFIQGQWIYDDGPPRTDPNCKRIAWLVDSCLIWVADHRNGWEKPYRDPEDSRLWELTYLQTELHGGGPPTLRLKSRDAASSKYGPVSLRADQ